MFTANSFQNSGIISFKGVLSTGISHFAWFRRSSLLEAMGVAPHESYRSVGYCVVGDKIIVILMD